ncbi:MAG: enoyl-CoA hydratase/isomerase family protein [Chloroflexi bacterium]|nr:enoyl-CoA hydratase/isomerase family protein [Chloroflexota bacterium]
MEFDANWVLYEKTGHIARITLNRPEKLNALTTEMNQRFMELLTQYQNDPDLRAMIITGAGRGFCPGEDAAEMAEMDRAAALKPEVMPHRSNVVPNFMVEAIDKPLIAAVNGVAAAMGYGIALACDIRVASETARFTHLYLKRGLVPSGEFWYLPRYMGMAQAMYYLLTGAAMDAQEALRWGLVCKVVPQERLQQEAMQIAEAVASQPPLSVRFTKRIARTIEAKPYIEAMDEITWARAIAKTAEGATESFQAFLDKKK